MGLVQPHLRGVGWEWGFATLDAKTGSDPPLPQRAVVKFRHKVCVAPTMGKKDLARPGVQGRSLFTPARSGHWWSVDPGVPGGQGDNESVWPRLGGGGGSGRGG